jgi:hypothetical protein
MVKISFFDKLRRRDTCVFQVFLTQYSAVRTIRKIQELVGEQYNTHEGREA